VLRLQERQPGYPPAYTSIEGLVDKLRASGRSPRSAAELTSMSVILQSWCESVSELGEWENIVGFIGWVQETVDFGDCSSLDEIHYEQFEAWLETELESAVDNADDLDVAQTWVDEVSSYADALFGIGAFAPKFQTFNERATEKWEPDSEYEHDYYYAQETSARRSRQETSTLAEYVKEYAASRPAIPQTVNEGRRQDDEISGLFDQLK
jgi:hypothetical protein